MAKRRLSKLLSTDSASQNAMANSKDPRTSDELVAALNQLSSQDFKRKYFSPHHLHPSPQQPSHGAPDIDIIFKSSSELTSDELTSCLNLIASTSRAHYEQSSFGWNPRRKRREMKEDEMRYLLVRTSTKPAPNDGGEKDNEIEGFLSFMLTHDSTPSVPVLYVYEVHLLHHLRKLGLGAHLMRVAEDIASAVEMEKVMLTCFVANESAYKFYRRRGYERDVCSPEDRTTRKKVVKADYVIMSREVR